MTGGAALAGLCTPTAVGGDGALSVPAGLDTDSLFR